MNIIAQISKNNMLLLWYFNNVCFQYSNYIKAFNYYIQSCDILNFWYDVISTIVKIGLAYKAFIVMV